MELSLAQKISDKVISVLAPYCEQIQVAGSVRRQRPEVNDIDIVILPKDRARIDAMVAERCYIEKSGPELITAYLRDAQRTQLDLWFARGPLTNSDMFATHTLAGNFGSVLLCRTGSKQHNIGLVEHAKRQELRWHPHDGVFRGQQLVASETEEQIFSALGLDFVPPEDRERFCLVKLA